jgi:hypothetical protein
MANFPLVTWQVTAPGAVWTENMSSSSPPIPDATDKWGFDVSTATSNGFATTDSATGYLGDAIDALGAGISMFTQFLYTNSTTAAMSPLFARYGYQSGSGGTLTFASLAEAAVYGFDSTTVTFPPTPGSSTGFITTPFNVGAVWMPCGVSGDITRTLKQRAAASSSEMSGLVTDVVNWGEVADIQLQSTLFPAANTFYWYASQAIYAQKAGRNVNDPNNILEKMLAAAATGVTFRIFEEAALAAGFTNTDYLVAKMPQVVTKASAMDVVQADDEPRLWTTTGLFFRGTT